MSPIYLIYTICDFNLIKKCIVECEQIKYHEIFYFKQSMIASIESFIEILKQNLEFKNCVSLIVKKQTTNEAEIVKLCGSFVFKIKNNF